MGLESLISKLEDKIEDPDEETFLLFSHAIPSQNLGFIDPAAQVLDLTVAGRDVVIHQSPAVLSSNRAGGTTGAVLWKVTPTCADWIASQDNILFTSGVLDETSAVLELGCGISPLNALAFSTRIAQYVLTDQPYVQKLILQNIEENRRPAEGPRRQGRARRGNYQRSHQAGSIHFKTLDWETDTVTASLTCSDDMSSFDAVLACDCVFNYALIEPFVQTCVDLCKLRESDTGKADRPCLCVVAQQLRNDDVFQSWLSTFCKYFEVWRLPDQVLPERLRPAAGFVVHIGILKTTDR